MNEFMQHPAAHGELLPALAAAITAACVLRSRLWALVPLAALLTTAGLTLGWGLAPLTAVRKLVLCVAGASVLAAALDAFRLQAGAAGRIVLAALVAAGAWWVGQRVLQQREGQAFALAVSGLALLSVTLTEAGRTLSGDALRSQVAALALAFTAGLLGFLGASLTVALTGIAIGSAHAVGLAAQLALRRRAAPELAFLWLPAAVFAVLGGVVVALTGGLPVQALVPLPLIPLAVRLAARPDRSLAWDVFACGLAALVPAALAVGLAWFLPGGAGPG